MHVDIFARKKEHRIFSISNDIIVTFGYILLMVIGSLLNKHTAQK